MPPSHAVPLLLTSVYSSVGAALQAVLQVERQVIGWFKVLQPGTCKKEAFPVCVVEDDIGAYYAFPQFEQPGMKIGKFNHLHEGVAEPERLERAISPADEQVSRSVKLDGPPANACTAGHLTMKRQGPSASCFERSAQMVGAVCYAEVGGCCKTEMFL